MQWNIDILNRQGADKNVVAITRFSYEYIKVLFHNLTITATKNIVCHTEDFIILYRGLLHVY